MTALYQAVLGRDPDRQGLVHHVRLLERGVSCDAIATGIAQSEDAATSILRSAALVRLSEVLWRARSEHRPRPRIYFLHIMKTGGTSLTQGLRRLAPAPLCLTDLFLDQLVVLPRQVLASSQFIAGHLSYEALDLLPPETTACTVIREPVERTLSHYWHLRHDPMVLAEEPNFSLETFLESPRWRLLSANYQCRHLVHRLGLSGAWIDFSPAERYGGLGPPFPEHHPLPLQSLFDSTPLQFDERTLTKNALARLADIEFVGLTERLDQLFTRLAALWGVTNPGPLSRTNISSGRPRTGNVPRNLVERIRAANAADVALYEQACTRCHSPGRMART